MRKNIEKGIVKKQTGGLPILERVKGSSDTKFLWVSKRKESQIKDRRLK